MVKKRRDEIERSIERALNLGSYIGYKDRSDFIAGVEGVKAMIVPLIRKVGDAARATTLLETFIAGCYEKAEEIDDSGGRFGEFVGELFCDWISARQAGEADPDETSRTLLSWIEEDDYGYCHDLAKEAVAVLDRAGLQAFERMVQEKASSSNKETYAHRQMVEALRAIHARRGDIDGYVSTCEAEGELAPADCETLAEMCLKRRTPEEALAWVKRGLELEKNGRWTNRSAWHLSRLKRDILKMLGRGADALASAWEDYCRSPSIYSYGDLMKLVPKGERREWHAKAMADIDSVDLESRIELLIKTREPELVARAIESASRQDLVALSHDTTGPAAKALTKAHPLLAAKLDIAMALRILEAKKSKYYDVALRNLGQARNAMLENGRSEEWQTLAEEIRTKHRRKIGFISGFESLGEGRSTRGPSFAERARERWKKGTRGGGA